MSFPNFMSFHFLQLQTFSVLVQLLQLQTFSVLVQLVQLQRIGYRFELSNRNEFFRPLRSQTVYFVNCNWIPQQGHSSGFSCYLSFFIVQTKFQQENCLWIPEPTHTKWCADTAWPRNGKSITIFWHVQHFKRLWVKYLRKAV